jgi:hypothetical protein
MKRIAQSSNTSKHELKARLVLGTAKLIKAKGMTNAPLRSERNRAARPVQNPTRQINSFIGAPAQYCAGAGQRDPSEAFAS